MRKQPAAKVKRWSSSTLRVDQRPSVVTHNYKKMRARRVDETRSCIDRAQSSVKSTRILMHDGESFGIELRYWSNRPLHVVVGAGSRIPSLPNEEITPVNVSVRVGRIDSETV